MQTPNVEGNQTSSTLSPSIAITIPIPSPTPTLVIPTPYHEHSRVSLAVNADDDSTPNNPLHTQCIGTEGMSATSLVIEGDSNGEEREYRSIGNKGTIKICRLCRKKEHLSKKQDTLPTCSSFSSSTLTPSKLISPCKCLTHNHYVHIECLGHWQNTQNDSRAHNSQFISCDKCGFQYGLNRLKAAQIISHWAVKHFYTMILLLLTVLLVSAIAHFAIKHLFKNGMDDFPSKSTDPLILNLDEPTQFFSLTRLDFICGVCTVSCFGIVYTILSLRFSSASPIPCLDIPLTCCAVPDQSEHGHNKCGCGGSNGDFVFVLIAMVFMLLASLVVCGLFGAVFGAYIFINRIVERVMEFVCGWMVEVGR